MYFIDENEENAMPDVAASVGLIAAIVLGRRFWKSCAPLLKKPRPAQKKASVMLFLLSN